MKQKKRDKDHSKVSHGSLTLIGMGRLKKGLVTIHVFACLSCALPW